MIIPVILSGGAGTRLWPVSRQAHPKPFMKMIDGQSLLQKTFLRAARLNSCQEILTLTNREYYFQTKDEYETVNINQKLACNFLLEPNARNTAPAIIFSCFYALTQHGPDTILLILPADHFIEDESTFEEICQQAQQLAESNKIISFGIQPQSPHTGFGYIECGQSYQQAFMVKQFTEKPDQHTAEQYIQSGCHLWNSGMLCFQAKTMIAEFQQHCPELLRLATLCWEQSQPTNAKQISMFELHHQTFSLLPDISIDYALLEKSSEVVVLPTQLKWSDVGCWDAISRLFIPDEHGNSLIGEGLLIDSTNTLVQSEDRLIACLGIDNLLVIDTKDALLVAHRSRAQEVKTIVAQLKNMAHPTVKTHQTVYRPWGFYTVLEEGNHYKIKRIVVKPQHTLSLQMHHYRSEHWVVIRGKAKVINGENTYLLTVNESTYIPANHRHRLENAGSDDLIIIEVQTGECLSEDDIVRFEDCYGRV